MNMLDALANPVGMILLRDAVRPASAPRDDRAGNRDGLAARIALGDAGQRIRVGVGAADGDDHRVVADVEVHVATGDRLALDLRVGQVRQLDDVDAGLLEPPRVLAAVAEVGCPRARSAAAPRPAW